MSPQDQDDFVRFVLGVTSFFALLILSALFVQIVPILFVILVLGLIFLL